MKEKIILFFETWKAIFSGFLFNGEIFSGVRASRERQKICNKCPYRDVDYNVCNECGCFISIKSKFKNATCPKGKWTKV